MRRALLLLVVVAGVCSCSSKKTPPPPPPPPVASDAAVAKATLEVRVDKRVELLSILMRLAGAPEYNAAKNAYARAVDAAFAAHAQHPAVVVTATMRKRGIAFDAAMNIAVHLTDNLEPHNAAELPGLDPRFERFDLAAYAVQVKQFAADAGFEAFFAKQTAEYAAAVDKVQKLVAGEDLVDFFAGVFGTVSDARYVVVPSLLAGGSNFGVRNGARMYQIVGEHATLPLIVHEIAHSYVDPIVAQNLDALRAPGESLYAHFAAAMRAQHYVDAQTMLDEAGVRAVTVLYVRDKQGDRAAAVQARDEMRAGFPYIYELEHVLRRHRADRAYGPALVEFFAKLAAQYATSPPKLPFIGPFDAVLRSDYTLVLPEHGALAAYVKQLPFFAKKRIAHAMVDGTSIVAYGTPASNPAVAQAAAWALWKITPQEISLGDKRFAGEHLVLVACWFRRDDPSRGIAIYAAADEADLVGVNHGLKHGARDWIVAKKTAKGFEIVETGDWPVENNAWVPFTK